jgi:hypothetical protein
MRAPGNDPIVRLLAYWLSAKLMHEHMHTLINVYRDRPGQAPNRISEISQHLIEEGML